MTREEGRTPSHVHQSASRLYVIAAKGITGTAGGDRERREPVDLPRASFRLRTPGGKHRDIATLGFIGRYRAKLLL